MIRSIWKGFISFRDVNIPVKLFSAVGEKLISFNLLHARDNTSLRQQMVCSYDDRTVPREHQIKGYPVSLGRYVVVTDDTSATSASDPMPTERATIPLRPALAKTGLAGICHWAIRRRSYMGALRTGRGASCDRPARWRQG